MSDLPIGRTLDDLANTINSEHELAYQSALDMLSHAINAGDALIEVRTRINEGDWIKWIKNNLTVSYGVAQRYIKIATYKNLLLDAENRPQSINAATSYLRDIGVASLPLNKTGRKPSFSVEEARRLRKLGMNFTQIGEVLGVSDVAVWRQLTPGAKEQTMRYTAKSRKQRTAERRAKEREDLAKAVAAKGGEIANAYALLRKTAIALDKAMTDTDDIETRKTLRDALSFTHRAEDAIVRALRFSRIRRVAGER
jgi:hypothetical protein